jgi:hypothetical protein
MQSAKRCYDLNVRNALVTWSSYLVSDDEAAAPTEGAKKEGNDVIKTVTVGCEFVFAVEASAQLYPMQLLIDSKPECTTCVQGGIAVRDCAVVENNTSLAAAAAGGGSDGGESDAYVVCCGNGFCDGAEMTSTCPVDCPPEPFSRGQVVNPSLEQTQTGESSNSYTSKGMLRWRASRGMEGRTVLTCIVAFAIDQGGFDSISKVRTPNNAASQCYVMTVERCAVCMPRGANIKSVSDTFLFKQDWLRMYNSNPFLLSPDRIPFAQRLGIGPIYNVQSGDTLLAIAGMAKTTLKAILVTNPHVLDPDRGLIPGTLICLPLCSTSPSGEYH